MKGLLKKDFIMIKTQLLQMALIAAFVIGILLYFDAPVGIVSFTAIYVTMQAVTTIIPDKMSGWNLYQTTFPISRANALREKYLFSFILLAIGYGIGFLVSWEFGIDPGSEEMLISSLIGLILALSALSLGIPLLEWMHKNAFMIAIFASFVPGAICTLLWQQALSNNTMNMEMVNGVPVMPEVNMHLDVLWWCVAVMAALAILSFMIAPLLLSRTDQK